MTVSYNPTIRTARLNAIVTEIGSGATLDIMSGTKPAAGGTATTVLATLALSTTPAAVSGDVLTFNTITADSSADATGTPTWFRVKKSGGAWALDGTAGATGSGADLELSGLSSGQIIAGGSVSIATPRTITAGNQ